MRITTASHAVQLLRELGMLVSPSLARLTSIIAFERGRLVLYLILDDQELVALARLPQLLHAGGGRIPSPVGISATTRRDASSDVLAANPAGQTRRAMRGMKGGGQ